MLTGMIIMMMQMMITTMVVKIYSIAYPKIKHHLVLTVANQLMGIFRIKREIVLIKVITF